MTCSTTREAELAAEGWSKRLTADEPRLSEAVEQYKALGFETRLEDLDPAACADRGGCASCFADPAAAARFKVVFTRRRDQAGRRRRSGIRLPAS